MHGTSGRSRPIGILLSLIGIVGGGLGIVADQRLDASFGLPELLAVGVVSAAALLFWLRYPTEERVRRAGERYAEQLLDDLPGPRASSGGT